MAKPIELRVDEYTNQGYVITWQYAKLVRVINDKAFLVRRLDGVLECVTDSSRIREAQTKK